MGPLGAAWVSLEQMRKEGTVADPATLLRNVEMAVCLIGQALWKTTNRRRLLWLTKFLGDFKKAATFLKEEESATTMSGKKLFGRAFLKRLYHRAKGTKQASMIKSVLGASKSKKLRRDVKPQPQPFRGAPPPPPPPPQPSVQRLLAGQGPRFWEVPGRPETGTNDNNNNWWPRTEQCPWRTQQV